MGPGYAGQPEPTVMPFYYRWYFRTGIEGDFEYLVTLLKPQPVNSQVGTRAMDVTTRARTFPASLADPALGGVLRLGGALEVPDADLNPSELATRQKYENWDQPYPHPFQKALATFINLPDDYAAQTAAAANAATAGSRVRDDPDPLITAPLYGRWHALTQRLLTKQDGTPADNITNWVHNLNLDPRFRVPASFATDVVETNAETYMDYAWQQIGDVLAANQKIRHLQLATEVATLWYQRSLTPLAAVNAERAFALTAPVAGAAADAEDDRRLHPDPEPGPAGAHLGAMRRVVRPGARLMRQLPFDAKATPTNLLDPHQCRRGQRGAAQGGAARPADRRSGGRRRRIRPVYRRLDPRPPRQVSVAALGRADWGAGDRHRAAARAAAAGGSHRGDRDCGCRHRRLPAAAPMADRRRRRRRA